MFWPTIWLIAAAFQTASGPVANAHQQGVQKYRNHDYEGAISLLTTAAQRETSNSPEFKESMLIIGQSYFMLSQAPKSIPFLEKVAGFTEADYMLGYAYIQVHRPELSEAAFARLFHLDALSAPGHLVAGQMLLKRSYEAEAQAEITKALQLDSRLPEANFLLGEIAIYQGRLPDAIKSLQSELALNPNFAMAWYRLGDAYSRQQQWAEGVERLERAIWLNPDFSGPYFLLGKCYLKQQNYANAEGILRKGLLLDPHNASGTYLLGQTLMAEGRSEEARAEMEKVKTLRAQPE
jgi:tetratricopeptide (TPR) repeat protein